MPRLAYDGVAVAVPVTVPYVRYSHHSSHHFAAQAMRLLLAHSKLDKSAVDGIIVSSFMLAPDTVVGLTQQMGLVPRWMDHMPTGGASGVMALRRAARAVQSGDANVSLALAPIPTMWPRSGRAYPTSASLPVMPPTPTAPAGRTPCSP